MATYTNITIDQNTGIGSGKIDGIQFNSVNLADGVWNAPNDVVLKTSKKKYFYIGTTKPTSLDYEGVTTVDEYPAELTFTNTGTSKCYVYVLTNADKTVIFYDAAMPSIPLTTLEDTTSIPGYKITTPSGDGINPSKLGINGQDIIRIITVTQKYYWYVGQIMPSDPNNSNQNTGVNKWTQLTSTPSQLSIYSQPSGGTWYVAIPHEYGFQAYDTTGTSPDTAAYNKSQITINSISYDLFTSANQMLKVNAVFKP